MAQMERALAMADMTVLTVVATVNSAGQIEAVILVEQACKVHAATVAKTLPSRGNVTPSERRGRHGADSLTASLLMDLLLAIVCPVALVFVFC